MNSISKLTVSLAFSISFLACAGCVFAHASSSITASNRKAERDYTSVVKNRNIRQIVCKGLTDIKFTQGSRFSVIVRGSDNLVDFTKIEVNGDKLIVSDKKFGNVNRYDNVAYITLPNVSSFLLQGIADIELTNTFSGHELKIQMDGTGDFELPNMSVNQFFVNLNGTGDLDCAGHAANITINTNGTGNIEGNLTGGNYTNVVANGTGDVILIGNCKAAKYFSFGTGNINARKYIVADVEARANGTGDVTCYATADFTGYRNTLASLTCYGGPRNRNSLTKGIVYPQVNESLAQAKAREEESQRINDYSRSLYKNADSYTTRAIRRNGHGSNGRLVVIEDGKVIEETEDDGREYMGTNNLRTRTRSDGNVEFMYYDEDGNLVIDRQSRIYREKGKSGNTEMESNRAEIARNNAEIARNKAEIARAKAEIQRSQAQARAEHLRKQNQTKIEMARSQAEAKAEIARSRAELARVRAELARERAALARERANRRAARVNEDSYESDYTETETETIYSGHDESLELKYDTRANKWVVYKDGKKIDRQVKTVTPAKSKRVKSSSLQSTTKSSSKSSSKTSPSKRKQRGVWENGSERTIFFEDGGQITIFTDENGRQRIISEE